MKLRVRSLSTNATVRVTAPDSSTLADLKSLIAAQLSPAVTDPSSLLLSLNRRDPLLSPDSAAPLASLGLTSGDLLFLLHPAPLHLTEGSGSQHQESGGGSVLQPVSKQDTGSDLAMQESVTLGGGSVLQHQESGGGSVLQQVSKQDMGSDLAMQESVTLGGGSVSQNQQSGGGSVLQPVSKQDMGSDLAMQESVTLGGGSVSDSALLEPSDPEAEPVMPPHPFASFLKGVMEAEQCQVTDDLGRLAVAVHAVFLQAGFIVSGMREGFLSRLPRGSPVCYTVPEAGDGVKVATVRFSAMRRYVTVHGFVSGGDGTTHRVCLDMLKTAPALGLDDNSPFQLWKVVRDGLVLPLSIDFCEMNGLDLPPCLARLPTELKTKILELLPGEDVARVSCVGRELRYIASDDELWRLRFMKEFGSNGSRAQGKTWKDKFMKAWLMAKGRSQRTRMQETHLFGVRDRFAPRTPFPLPGIIGGDYDLFPSFGGIGPLGHGPGFPHLPGTGMGLPRRPGRRNFSPQCNLDELDPGFM